VGRPLVWVTCAFAVGIWAADRRLLDPESSPLLVGALCAVWLLLLAVRRGPTSPPQRALLSAAPLVVFAALGALAVALDPIHDEAAAAARWHGRRALVEARVSGPVTTNGDRQRAPIRILRVNGRALPVGFSVLATLPAQPRLRYGDVLSVHGTIAQAPDGGNPGEASLRDALRRQGIAALLRGARPPLVILARGKGNPLVAWGLALRDRLVHPLLMLPDPYGGVLAGLLYGVPAGVPEAMEEIFRRAGLLHVLVVSGAQVGLLAAASLAALAVLRAGAGARIALAGGLILLFATMVGWGAAVGRAAIMALVGLAAALFRRDPDPPTALACAALLWLALHPAALFSLGFQLSFAATWGLLVLTPLLTPPLRPRWLAQVMGATLGAQLAVLPLLAATFQRVSLAAFPANLAVLPIVAILVPGGFVLSLAGLVLPGMAGAAAPAFLPLVWAIVAASRFFADAPGAQVWVPPVPWWHVAAAYGLLGMLPRWRARGIRWPTIGIWTLLAAAVFWTGRGAAETLARPQLLVAVLDVGQGDAILVRGPAARAMLVDGGGEVQIAGRPASPAVPGDRRAQGRHDHLPPRRDVGLQRVVPTLRRLNVRRLDVIVLSHAHEDHVGGLPAVLQNFSVGLVLDPGVPHPSPSYVRFLELVRRRRVPYALARRGQRVGLGTGATAELLWPPEEAPGRPLDAERAVHARMVVVRVQYGQISVLLTGDIEADLEAALVKRGMALGSTVLKVAHHGSRTSTTPAFLEAVHPASAVISVGSDNPFDHPHAQTLRTLVGRGVRAYRTDRDGAVLLWTDGRTLRITTVRPRPAVADPGALGVRP